MSIYALCRGKFPRPLCVFLLVLLVSTHAWALPFATSVESYLPGADTNPAFQDPAVALGMPATENGFGDVTPFASAFTGDLLVQVGSGGELVIGFDEPVLDNPPDFSHGIDLLIFGNAFFFNPDFTGPTLALDVFAEAGDIAVSQDGAAWFPIHDVTADGLFPTQGYRDSSDPFADDGTLEADFAKPVDPGIDWLGATFEEIVGLYDGSGGGTGVDFSSTGLAWIQFVRVSVPADAMMVVEVDAFSDVTAIGAFQLLHLQAFRFNKTVGQKDDSFVWRGRVDLPEEPDPLTHGLSFALFDPIDGSEVFSVTIPGGAFESDSGVQRGWRRNRKGTAFFYRERLTGGKGTRSEPLGNVRWIRVTDAETDTPGGFHDVVIRAEALNLDPLHAVSESGVAARIEFDVGASEQKPGDSRCTFDPPAALVPGSLHCRRP